jgi:hypothetical protein
MITAKCLTDIYLEMAGLCAEATDPHTKRGPCTELVRTLSFHQEHRHVDGQNDHEVVGNRVGGIHVPHIIQQSVGSWMPIMQLTAGSRMLIMKLR